MSLSITVHFLQHYIPDTLQISSTHLNFWIECIVCHLKAYLVITLKKAKLPLKSFFFSSIVKNHWYMLTNNNSNIIPFLWPHGRHIQHPL